MKTKINQLVSGICLKEGKKKQVSVGNVREVMRVLKDVVNADAEMFKALWVYLLKR